MKEIDLVNVGMIGLISMSLYKLNDLKSPQKNAVLFQNILRKQNKEMLEYIEKNEKFLRDNTQTFHHIENYEQNFWVKNNFINYFSDEFLLFHLIGFILFLILLNLIFPMLKNVKDVVKGNFVTSLSLFVLVLIFIFSLNDNDNDDEDKQLIILQKLEKI